MKKIIASILIPSFMLYFFGCYSMSEISKEEFTGQSEEALLLTDKMETYQLEEGQYYVKADTIFGKGSKQLTDGSQISLTESIPLENITVFNVKESDGFKTVFLALGIIAGVVLLAYALFVGSAVGALTY